jgi:hypothetical protein
MVWHGAVRRGEAGFGKVRRGMGLIADRGLEIVLLRVLRHLAWSGSMWWGMVGFGLVWQGTDNSR